ncbi:MAG: cupredoxin domain-containing protein, partial [Nanoarchaeota archaeon]
KIFRIDLTTSLKKTGYIYLPLTFSIMFFTIVFGFLSPYFETSFNFVAFAKYIILSIGAVWSIYFSYKLTQKYNKVLGNTIITASILLISILWLFYFIPGPFNASLTPERHVLLEENQTLKITAFSMGFDPKIITVKKGQKVDLSIKNIDIVHAFDIDEFGVHLALLNGKTTNASFVADKAGEFAFYCNVPGHTEAGMKGKLIVES